MISGIKHIAPPEKHASVAKLKLRIARETPDTHLQLSGFCIAMAAFGSHPTLRLTTRDAETDLAFSDSASPRQGKRFADVSANADHCNLPDITLHATDMPATLSLVSEDGTQTAPLAFFEYDPVEQLHDRLIRMVEARAIDLDALEQAFAALPDDTRSSDQGVLMGVVLNIMRHSYNGTGEADLRAIRRIFRGRERFRMYPRYVDLLNLAIAPMTYGNHGLTQTFAHMDLGPDFWTGLNAFLASLTSEFGPSFLVSGSLLGLIREGGLLPHDDDLDIAILLPASNAAEAAEQWLAVRQSLDRKGLLNAPMTATARLPLLKSMRINGVPTDLFPAWLEGDRVFVFPHTFGELTKSDVLPLALDKTFGAPIPRCPEKMLEINYGPGWRVPDPSATLDWPRWNKNYRPLLDADVFKDW